MVSKWRPFSTNCNFGNKKKSIKSGEWGGWDKTVFWFLVQNRWVVSPQLWSPMLNCLTLRQEVSITFILDILSQCWNREPSSRFDLWSAWTFRYHWLVQEVSRQSSLDFTSTIQWLNQEQTLVQLEACSIFCMTLWRRFPRTSWLFIRMWVSSIVVEGFLSRRSSSTDREKILIH